MSTSEPQGTREQVEELISTILQLGKGLPDSIPEGKKSDQLHRVMTTVSGDSHWGTFNRRFDILFGEDCRDANGRLHHIRRGRYGFAMVMAYLQRTVDENLGSMRDFYIPMVLKLDRLKCELEVLCNTAPKTANSLPSINSASENALPSSGAVVVNEPVDTSSSSTDDGAAKQRSAESEASLSAGKKAVDVGPARQQQRSQKGTIQLMFGDLPADSVKDKSYKGGVVRNRSESPIPEYQLDADGLEIVPDTSSDEERPVAHKRKRPIVVDSSEDSADSDDELASDTTDTRGPKGSHQSSGRRKKQRVPKKSKVSNVGARRTANGKYKRPPRPQGTAQQRKKQHRTRPPPSETDHSDEERSDGRSALREVQEAEEEAAQRTGSRGPRNESLQHWHEPKAIVEAGKGKRWSFKCRYCSTYRTFPRNVDSTNFRDETLRPVLGNLSAHTKIHRAHIEELAASNATSTEQPATGSRMSTGGHGMTIASARLMQKYLEDGKLNPKHEPTRKGFLRLFAAWILEEDLPFVTGEAPGLHRLFEYLQVRFELPTDTTVRNTLAHIFADLHAEVVKELAAVKSKIAYSTDTWSTPQMMFTFAGTIGSFIDDDWNLIERLLDFRHLSDNEHQGVHAAHAFMDSGSKRGSLNKISSHYSLRPDLQLTDFGLHFIAITMDNAATNDVLARTLGRLLLQRYNIHFSPDNGQIRCLAHVVNLVVQKILTTLENGEEPDPNDWYLLNKHLPVHYVVDDDDEQCELETESAAKMDEELRAADPTEEPDDTLEWGLSAVQKLRLIATKVCGTPQRRSAFRKHAERHYKGKYLPNGKEISSLMPVRDVRTRWNYTHAMIERAKLLRKAINDWVSEREEFECLTLSVEDWRLLEVLGDLLAKFTDVTHIVSLAGTPTLPWVIPMYHHMRVTLEKSIKDNKLPALTNAANAALLKLNQYYSKALDCQFNIVATLCHPALRHDWFDNLGDDQKDKAWTLFEHVYAEYEKTTEKPKDKPAVATPITASGSFLANLANVAKPRVVKESSARPELSRWKENEGGGGDFYYPLVWWKAHAHEFPVISRIARDFLAIPAASVSVERLFSSSRQLCSDVRSSLKAETISVAMCTKQWIRQGLLKA